VTDEPETASPAPVTPPRRRRWPLLIGLTLLALLALLAVAHWQRERIAFWRGHYEVFLDRARLERNQTIVVRHTGLKELAPDVVYQFVIRGPQGIGLWDRSSHPGEQAIRTAPKETWLTQKLKPEELRQPGELSIQFPMEFATVVDGMLECSIQRRPRTEEDDQPRKGGLHIRVALDSPEAGAQTISNVVAIP
jgi:hypothetical protein